MKQGPLAVVIVLVLAAGGVGFYILRGNSGNGNDLMGFEEISLAHSGATDGATSTADVPKALSESTPQTTQVSADMRGYQNAQFHFGLLYPRGMVVREYVEKDGAITVTFDNETTNEGFQIYVTPFSGKQITTERFKLDQPSGVYREPTDVVVGDTRATMFFGQNSIMGETREVWFIRGGLLYEVTTYKELDTWLGGIMQTWKFI